MTGVTNREVTIGNITYTPIRRAWTQRDFLLEVRKSGTAIAVKYFTWGYTWNNDNAAWANQSKPPSQNGGTSARDDLGTGAFVGLY